MSETSVQNRPDPKNGARHPLVWLALVSIGTFVLLITLLGWVAARTGGGLAEVGALNIATQSITLAYETEPPQLDSTKSQDKYGSYVLGHVMEGLLRQDEHGAIVGGVADGWEIAPQRATFHLRPDARWSDGRPVTAHDFVFAWRTVVDPKTASEYAFILYSVKNAEAVNTGKLPVEALGVRATDDRTLEVDLERPVAFFDKLVAFKTYFPVREDFYATRQGRYGADANDLLYNGPFMLTRWVHGASFRFEKNPHYWNRGTISLDRIDHPYITQDPTAILNLYKDGRVAMAGQSIGMEPDQLDDVLAQRWPIQKFNDGSVWYIDMNHRAERVTRSFHLRKALQLVVDPGELVNQVIKLPGYLPGESLFPVWIRGVEAPFRREYPAPRMQPDFLRAREHLQRALEELGVDELPPISILLTDSPLNSRICEYLQAVFKERLGIDVFLDRQIFRQRIEKMNAGEFDLVLAGWSPDFDDPLTYGDLYASWNLNNRGRYNNPEVDRAVRLAMDSLEPKVRMDAFARVQNLLIEDVALIPLYERGQVFVSDKRLKGVVRRVVGTDPDFTHAYLINN